MRRTAVWAALAVLLLRSTATASTPPCVARAALEPDSAFVGQQVVWKVHIDSRDDVAEISWVDTPAFASIRTERLPGSPVVPEARETPPRYTTREEHRALFAERTGEIPIESPGLLCKLSNGVVLDTPVAPVTLSVLPFPASGRPDDFAGVIGPLVLQTHVDRDQLSLGETIHVTVSIRGAGNLWDVADPLRDWKPAETDLFTRKPQLELQAGKRLSVQKIFRYEVVPRSAGTISVPPLSLSHFEPIETRYAVARSASIEVAVSPRLRQPTKPAQPDRAPPLPATEPHTVPSRKLPVIAFVVTVALAIALALWRRSTRVGSVAAPIETGDADRDAGEWVRALRAALDLRAAETAAQPAGKSASETRSASEAEAAKLLEALERSRFDPNTEPPPREAIVHALERLRGSGHGRT